MFSPTRRRRRKPKTRRVLGDITSVAEYERVYVSRQRTLMQKAFELEEATGALITVTVRSSSSGDVAFFASNDELIQKLKNGDLIKNDSHRFTQQYFCSASTFNMSGLQNLLQRAQSLVANSNALNNNGQSSTSNNQNSDPQDTSNPLNAWLNSGDGNIRRVTKNTQPVTSRGTRTAVSPTASHHATEGNPSVAVVDPVPKLNKDSQKSFCNDTQANSAPSADKPGSTNKSGSTSNIRPKRAAAETQTGFNNQPTKPTRSQAVTKPKQSPNRGSRRPTFLTPKPLSNQNQNLNLPRNEQSPSGGGRINPELSLDINIEVEAVKPPLANQPRLIKSSSSSSSESDDTDSSESSSSEDGDEDQSQSSDCSDTDSSDSKSSDEDSVLEIPQAAFVPKPFVINPSASVLPTPELPKHHENTPQLSSPYDFVNALAPKKKSKPGQHKIDKTMKSRIPPKENSGNKDATPEKSPVAIVKQEPVSDPGLKCQALNKSPKCTPQRSKSVPPSENKSPSPSVATKNLTLQRKSSRWRVPQHPKRSAVSYWKARQKQKLTTRRTLLETPEGVKPLGLIDKGSAPPNDPTPPEAQALKQSKPKETTNSKSNSASEWRYFNSTPSNDTTTFDALPFKSPLLKTPPTCPIAQENTSTKKRPWSAPAGKPGEPQEGESPVKRDRKIDEESTSLPQTKKLDSQRLLLRCKTFIERAVSAGNILKGYKNYPLSKFLDNDRFHNIKADIMEHLGPRSNIIHFMAKSLQTSKFLEQFQYTYVRRHQLKPPVHKRRQNNARQSVEQVPCIT